MEFRGFNEEQPVIDLSANTSFVINVDNNEYQMSVHDSSRVLVEAVNGLSTLGPPVDVFGEDGNSDEPSKGIIVSNNRLWISCPPTRNKLVLLGRVSAFRRLHQ